MTGSSSPLPISPRTVGARFSVERILLLAIVLYRCLPGPLPVDLATLGGGGQLFMPVALSGMVLAAFSAWLMRFEPWRQPSIALTTILCVVLFVLQFQANRACLDGIRNKASATGEVRLSRNATDTNFREEEP